MFEKKTKKGMSDVEQKAKMSVVEAMRKMAEEEMGGRVGGLKKVTVASKDENGLKAGLDKAKELVGHMPDDESMEDPNEELSESPEMEASEDEPTTPEEIDEKIKELLLLKEKMQS